MFGTRCWARVPATPVAGRRSHAATAERPVADWSTPCELHCLHHHRVDGRNIREPSHERQSQRLCSVGVGSCYWRIASGGSFKHAIRAPPKTTEVRLTHASTAAPSYSPSTIDLRRRPRDRPLACSCDRDASRYLACLPPKVVAFAWSLKFWTLPAARGRFDADHTTAVEALNRAFAAERGGTRSRRSTGDCGA